MDGADVAVDGERRGSSNGGITRVSQGSISAPDIPRVQTKARSDAGRRARAATAIHEISRMTRTRTMISAMNYLPSFIA
jgi:hypothetical protein